MLGVVLPPTIRWDLILFDMSTKNMKKENEKVAVVTGSSRG